MLALPLGQSRWPRREEKMLRAESCYRSSIHTLLNIHATHLVLAIIAVVENGDDDDERADDNGGVQRPIEEGRVQARS